MATLPACPARFATRKAAILAQLDRPDGDYTDASPKGAVDEGVRPLLAVINGFDGFVTTSSCGGRVAVFLEGRGARGAVEEPAAAATTMTATTPAQTRASSGGKGGGGKWLFVSHDPLVKAAEDSPAPAPYSSYSETDWSSVFGLETGDDEKDALAAHDDDDTQEERLVHFKFEPMILHVLTASLAHAQLLLRCASAAGFRESGAVSIVPAAPPPAGGKAAGDDDGAADPAMPIVAVRSMGLALASVVGVGRDADSDRASSIVSPRYLARLVRVADERFAVNRARTERFRAALVAAVEQEEGRTSSSKNKDAGGWEDAEARRARKKAEGLRRQAALKDISQADSREETDGPGDGGALDGGPG